MLKKLKIKFFIGVFSISNLPKLNITTCSLIVNTRPLPLPGEHCVSIKVKKKRAEYFDLLSSFPLSSILNWFRKSNLNYKHNSKVFQNPFSESCGLFCLYFLKCNLTKLTTNVRRNENKVKNILFKYL